MLTFADIDPVQLPTPAIHLIASDANRGVVDASGNGRDGVAVGGAAVADDDRGFCFAVGCNGATQGIDLTTHLTWLKTLTAATYALEYRVPAGSVSAELTLMGIGSSTHAAHDFEIAIQNPNALRVRHRNSGTQLRIDATSQNYDGDLVFKLVFTIGAGGNALYVNGAKLSPTYVNGSSAFSTMPSTLTNTNRWTLCHHYGGSATPSKFAPVRLANFMVFDSALSEEQAKYLSSPNQGIVLWGQSNVVGQGAANAANAPNNRVLELRRSSPTDELLTAAGNLQHAGGAAAGQMGFGIVAAKDLIPALLNWQRWLIIPCGNGGKGIIWWSEGNTGDLDVIARTNLAISKGCILRGVLGHQGETNATSDYPNYATDLDTVFGRYRGSAFIDDALGGHSALPIILGQLCVEADPAQFPYREVIDGIITATPSRLVNTAVVKTHYLHGLTSPAEPYHFNAEALEFMGHQYARNYLVLAGLMPDVVGRSWGSRPLHGASL